MRDDKNGLERFIAAQKDRYQDALREIRAGRKRSHWMWYVFPQLAGLGISRTSAYYGIQGMEEARAYLKNGVLGPRLVEISEALLELPAADAHAVFGSPDHLKLQSSMTLFALASDAEPVFRAVLEKYFAGEMDKKTLQMLAAPRPPGVRH
ncbi:MAG: DUF1810 domain-containing protein [Planctomycetota bacterium]|nr:DUF1810 domain-containing protein [Planctomycetota bacterium]